MQITHKLPNGNVAHFVSTIIKKDGEYINGLNLEKIEINNPNVIIPDYVDGKPVISISQAFKDSKISSIKLPETLIELRAGAFCRCAGLTEIKLPPNLKQIQSRVFNGCDSLERVDFNSEITSIGDEAFYGCDSLKDVDLSKTKIEKIDARSFAECAKLSSVNLPDTIVTIPKLCFAGCENLQSVNFGTALTEIGEHAFLSCRALKELDFSNTVVEKFYASTFAFCTNLSVMTLSPFHTDLSALHKLPLSQLNIPKENRILTNIDGVVYRKEPKMLLYYPPCLKKEEYRLEDDCVAVASDTFKNCKFLKSIDFNNCKKIGPRCLMDSLFIQNIKISENTKLIPLLFAFNCHNLNSISIPKNIEKIDSQAFKASGLKKIRIEGTPNIESSAFDYISDKCNVKCVPNSCVEDFFKNEVNVDVTISSLSSDINMFLNDISEEQERKIE